MQGVFERMDQDHHNINEENPPLVKPHILKIGSISSMGVGLRIKFMGHMEREELHSL